MIKLSLNVYSHFYLAVKPTHKLNSLSSNQTVLQGNDATFNCRTEAFPTATTYRWFNDGNQITNSAKFEIFNVGGAEESRLTIKNAQKGTAGQYSCDGTNGVGTGERKTAFLLVYCKFYPFVCYELHSVVDLSDVCACYHKLSCIPFYSGLLGIIVQTLLFDFYDINYFCF